MYVYIGSDLEYFFKLQRVVPLIMYWRCKLHILVWTELPLDQSVRSNILCSFYSLGYKVSNKICLRFFWALHVYFRDQILQTQKLLKFDKIANIY